MHHQVVAGSSWFENPNRRRTTARALALVAVSVWAILSADSVIASLPICTWAPTTFAHSALGPSAPSACQGPVPDPMPLPDPPPSPIPPVPPTPPSAPDVAGLFAAMADCAIAGATAGSGLGGAAGLIVGLVYCSIVEIQSWFAD